VAWSIFTNGGGNGAALTWAVDLLHKIGAPTSPANQQVIYDWEVSEGGGGSYNPLNEGADPANPALTSGTLNSSGVADYKSWSAGLQGTADYLAMPSFVAIGDALRANNPAAARDAIIRSPWASNHYGGGAAFSGAALPNGQAPLATAGGSPNAPVPPGSPAALDTGSLTSVLGNLGASLNTLAVVVPAVIGGAALVVWGMARMTGTRPAADAAKIGAMLLWTSTTTRGGGSAAAAASSLRSWASITPR